MDVVAGLGKSSTVNAHKGREDVSSGADFAALLWSDQTPETGWGVVQSANWPDQTLPKDMGISPDLTATAASAGLEVGLEPEAGSRAGQALANNGGPMTASDGFMPKQAGLSAAPPMGADPVGKATPLAPINNNGQAPSGALMPQSPVSTPPFEAGSQPALAASPLPDTMDAVLPARVPPAAGQPNLAAQNAAPLARAIGDTASLAKSAGTTAVAAPGPQAATSATQAVTSQAVFASSGSVEALAIQANVPASAPQVPVQNQGPVQNLGPVQNQGPGQNQVSIQNATLAASFGVNVLTRKASDTPLSVPISAPQGTPGQRLMAAHALQTAKTPGNTGSAAQPSANSGSMGKTAASPSHQPPFFSMLVATAPASVAISPEQEAGLDALGDLPVDANADWSQSEAARLDRGTSLPAETTRARSAPQQVMQAVMARLQSGATQFTLRLDPVDLGRVEVKMTFDAQGRIGLHIEAEQGAALDALAREVRVLERAFSDIGLRISEDGIRFSLKSGGHDGQERGQGSPENFGARSRANPDGDDAERVGPSPIQIERWRHSRLTVVV